MQSIVESIKIQENLNPHKLCVADYNGVNYTYREYWCLVKKVAQYFTQKGLKKDDLVIVESFQSGTFIAIGLGIQLAGGVFVPVEKKLSKKRIFEIQNDMKAKFILSGMRIKRKDALFLDEVLKQINMQEKNGKDWLLPNENELAEILLTTGTTGKSKGIMITHKANVALGQNISYGVQMKKDNIELIPVPINHSYGLRSFYASLYNGSSIVLLDGFSNPGEFFLAIEKYKVTSIALVPAIIRMIFQISKDYITKYMAQLDYIQSGSAALSEDLKEQLCTFLPQSRLFNFYGSTESGRCCILDYSIEKEKVNCIGKPAHNACFEIVGEEEKIISSSRNNIGRLACKGTMNMIGYWNEQDETELVMKNGFILTNDLCYIEDGYVYYVGRKGDIINVGGNKISPIEIEEVVNAFTEVTESICVPMKDDILGQVPILYVVWNEGKEFDKVIFLKQLSKELEEYKIPRDIKTIAHIPRMYNGKIDRKSLRKT